MWSNGVGYQVSTILVFSQDKKMVARKHSRSFQNLWKSWMFSSVNDSQYMVFVMCGRLDKSFDMYQVVSSITESNMGEMNGNDSLTLQANW